MAIIDPRRFLGGEKNSRHNTVQGQENAQKVHIFGKNGIDVKKKKISESLNHRPSAQHIKKNAFVDFFLKSSTPFDCQTGCCPALWPKGGLEGRSKIIKKEKPFHIPPSIPELGDSVKFLLKNPTSEIHRRRLGEC